MRFQRFSPRSLPPITRSVVDTFLDCLLRAHHYDCVLALPFPVLLIVVTPRLPLHHVTSHQVVLSLIGLGAPPTPIREAASASQDSRRADGDFGNEGERQSPATAAAAESHSSGSMKVKGSDGTVDDLVHYWDAAVGRDRQSETRSSAKLVGINAAGGEGRQRQPRDPVNKTVRLLRAPQHQ